MRVRNHLRRSLLAVMTRRRTRPLNTGEIIMLLVAFAFFIFVFTLLILVLATT
jgi:hypothetical protein